MKGLDFKENLSADQWIFSKEVEMLVKNWMSKKVITVDVNDSTQDVMEIFTKSNIRRLPVMKRGKLVGIVMDRDLRSASASEATSLEVHDLAYLIKKIKVSEIMTKNPLTVPLDYTIEEAAIILLDNKISGVPVVNRQDEMVGIITQTDLFRALISLTGGGEKGIQFALELEDRPGSIKDVADIIRAKGGRMVSILTTYDQAPHGYRNVYIRAYGIDRDRLSLLEKQLQDNGRMLYIIDHEQNRREIY